MPLSSAIPAAFWLIAEGGIALALTLFLFRIRQAHSRIDVAAVLLLVGIGMAAIIDGQRLFAIGENELFGRKAAWNLLCLLWVILELLILVNISLIVAECARRFLCNENAAPAVAISSAYRVSAILALLFVAFHWHLFQQSKQTIELWSYAYVRAIGFLYIALEAGIAFVLYDALKTTRLILGKVRL